MWKWVGVRYSGAVFECLVIFFSEIEVGVGRRCTDIQRDAQPWSFSKNQIRQVSMRAFLSGTRDVG